MRGEDRQGKSKRKDCGAKEGCLAGWSVRCLRATVPPHLLIKLHSPI